MLMLADAALLPENTSNHKMEMQMELYWPQDKVFEHGKRVLTDRSDIPRTLELLSYLDQFMGDNLTTGNVIKPEKFISQQEKLLLAARQLYPKYGHQPIIRMADVWTDRSDWQVGVATFWELIFAMHFRTDFIEIINVGHDGAYKDRTTGKSVPSPFVEFRIKVGTLFYDAVSPPRLKKVVPATVQQAKTNNNVTLSMNSRGTIYVETADQKQYKIKQVRVDGTPYGFMNYMLSRPDTTITRATLEAELRTTLKDITELVRQCGFTNELHPLKSVFFPELSKTKVRFRRTAMLKNEDLTLLADPIVARMMP